MPTTRSNDQLRDLMLIGLTWVQEETGHLTGWTGNGVLVTMRSSGALSDQQYRQIAAGDPTFRSYLFPMVHLMYGAQIGQAAVRRASRSTDKLLIAMVNTPMFFGDKLFAPRGYKMVATEAGQRHALGVSRSYTDDVTRETFLSEWRRHSRQMRGMHAAAMVRRES